MLKKILSLLFLPFLLFSEEPSSSNFFLISIPKSGTHLSIKLIEQISNKEHVNVYDWKNREMKRDVEKITPYLDKTFANNMFPFMHFEYFDVMKQYMKKNSNCRPIVNIRDLRDVCVSNVLWFSQGYSKLLGPKSSFNKRLSFAITKEEDYLAPSTALNCKRAMECMENYAPLVVRFEDVVGEGGGGDDILQIETIHQIAAHLGHQLTDDEALNIAENAFGHSNTFRKGQIGQWKTMFTEEHKELFKKSPLGEMLIELGYETDYNW